MRGTIPAHLDPGSDNGQAQKVSEIFIVASQTDWLKRSGFTELSFRRSSKSHDGFLDLGRPFKAKPIGPCSRPAQYSARAYAEQEAWTILIVHVPCAPIWSVLRCLDALHHYSVPEPYIPVLFGSWANTVPKRCISAACPWRMSFMERAQRGLRRSGRPWPNREPSIRVARRQQRSDTPTPAHAQVPL